MNLRVIRFLFCCGLLTLGGCAHHQQAASSAPAPQGDDASQQDLIPVLAALHDQMHTWQDTPYQWGGTNLNGVDCSGFVWRTLKDRFNLPVERMNTGDLLKMGQPVKESQLRTGDLVFFRIDGGMHVGFYDTSRNFLHASVSKGVIRSSLDNPYWQKVYYQARRLPKEVGGQITLNREGQHIAKNG